MNSYISNIYDFDSMCKIISREMDLPDSFYGMEFGTGNSSEDAYFKIKGRAFASSPMRQQGRGIRFKKKVTTKDAISQFEGVDTLSMMDVLAQLTSTAFSNSLTGSLA